LDIDLKQLDALAREIIKIAEQQKTKRHCRQLFQHVVCVGMAGLRNFGSDHDIKRFIDGVLTSELMPIVEIEADTVQ